MRLRRTLATDAALVRAIPLPAVRERRSVTVTCPSNPVVNALFERLGRSPPVADAAAFNVFSALTATLTTHSEVALGNGPGSPGTGQAAQELG